MDLDSFRNPGKEYREVPFWAWNDDLDLDELRRQISLMNEAGWGGFFMHSRLGLKIPYLGKRWMACIRACVEEARRHGMGAWIYDEDKWPSGFAGGFTPAESAEYRPQALVCLVDNKPALLKEALIAFTARQEGGQLVDFAVLEDIAAFDGDAQVLAQFYVRRAPLGDPWFNGYTYIDMLNPQAVQAFIQNTYQRYADEVGKEFGRAVPGIFTDEPAYFDMQNPAFTHGGVMRFPIIPWTEGFAAYFHERAGYDLLPHLPLLFFDTGPYQQIRYDYWRAITQRFVESFSKQVYTWCDEHGLAFTGHYLCEDTLWLQTQFIGAAMPHYEYQHIPGIDKLARNLFTVLTVKQLDSAVCQLGKSRALSESYGGSGQGFSLTGRKWIGDWLYVLGITLHNPHLSLYSMRGERKRDWPPNLYYQQPWWPENRLVADYFARLSYALSQRQRVVDILVIHPISSAWVAYRPDSNREVRALDEALRALESLLLSLQRDFHYGDELLMEKYARVDRDRLVVGEMDYRVVIVPPSITLARNTVELLQQFAAKGGTVLALEPPPTLVDGRPGEGSVLPADVRLIDLDREALRTALDEALPFDVSIPNQPHIWVHHRRDGDQDIYFIVNTRLEEGGVVTVRIRGQGLLEEWDPVSGEVRPLPCAARNGITEVVLDFPPVGSHLLVLHRDRPPASIALPMERVTSVVLLDEKWQVRASEPNVLTLDFARLRIGEGDWSELMYVLDAQDRVAEAGPGTSFWLRFAFEAAVRPEGKVFLVLESPERFKVTFNSHPLSGEDSGYWRDISFRKLDVTDALRAGENEVVITGVFGRETELESIYLLGNFAVPSRRIEEVGRSNGQVFYSHAVEPRITAPRCTVHAGDLTSQGFPFFAGRLTLSQQVVLSEIEGRVSLHLKGLHAAVARVRVNGQEMGLLAWVDTVDITDALHTGENEIEIELLSTLRNLLGPHHQREGDRELVPPWAFRDKAGWIDDYVLMPFGFKASRLVTREVSGY